MRRLFVVFTVSVSAIVAHPSAITAQSASGHRGSMKWAVMDAIGYGGVGAVAGTVVGVAVSQDCPFGSCTGVVTGFLGGTVAGMALGTTIGLNARHAIESGEGLSSGHRVAVILGTVLAGTTAGALSSAFLINAGDKNGDGSGTTLGSDEATFGALTIGGTALGVIVASRNARELNTRRLSIAPSIGRGRYGIDAGLTF